MLNLMNTAEIYDRVFDIYRKSFLKHLAFAGIAAICGAIIFFMIAFVVALIFGVLAAFLIADMNVYGGGLFNDSSMIILIIAIALVLVVIFILWESIFSAGHILLSELDLFERHITFPGERIIMTVLRVFSVMLAQLILLTPYVAAAGGLIFGAFTLSGETAAIVAGVAALIGLFIYANIFALSVAAAVIENLAFFSAIARGWQLIRENFWRVFFVKLMWLFVTLIISYTLQGAFSFFVFIANMFFGGIDFGIMMLANTLFALVNLVLTFAIMPLNGISQAVIYVNQRIKREGLDIQLKMQRLLQ